MTYVRHVVLRCDWPDGCGRSVMEASSITFWTLVILTGLRIIETIERNTQ